MRSFCVLIVCGGIFIFFWQIKIGERTAHEILAKLTSGGLLPCKKYSLEIAPTFKEIEGVWKEIKFSTFPDESLFGVKITDKVSISPEFLSATVPERWTVLHLILF